MDEPRVVALSPDGEPRAPVPAMSAHEPPGMLHLAVSVQVVGGDGLWLVQRRARAKRPFANRWANSCCTHPFPGESPEQAGRRRLEEELGLVVDQLFEAGTFTYRADDPASGLVEHETDRVYLARPARNVLDIDPEQIAEVAWLPYEAALEKVSGAEGAPWAARVMRLAAEIARATQ